MVYVSTSICSLFLPDTSQLSPCPSNTHSALETPRKNCHRASLYSTRTCARRDQLSTTCYCNYYCYYCCSKPDYSMPRLGSHFSCCLPFHPYNISSIIKRKLQITIHLTYLFDNNFEDVSKYVLFGLLLYNLSAFKSQLRNIF